MDIQIRLHIVELCLFLFSLFWVAMRETKFIQLLPFRIIAILTIFVTVLCGIALSIYDIILFFKSL